MQMLEHNLELENLHRKGNSIMTNVRVVCEQRHLEQRKREKKYEEGRDSMFLRHEKLNGFKT